MASGLAGRKKRKLITISANMIGKMSENRVLQHMAKVGHEKTFDSRTWENLNLRLNHLIKMKAKINGKT
jgi:hypothetical protein